MFLCDAFEFFFMAMIRPGVLKNVNEIKKCDCHDEKKLQINDDTLLQYNFFLISLISLLNTYPAVIDLLKVNNKHNRVSCAISTKLRAYSSFSIYIIISIVLSCNQEVQITIMLKVIYNAG